MEGVFLLDINLRNEEKGNKREKGKMGLKEGEDKRGGNQGGRRNCILLQSLHDRWSYPYVVW